MDPSAKIDPRHNWSRAKIDPMPKLVPCQNWPTLCQNWSYSMPKSVPYLPQGTKCQKSPRQNWSYPWPKSVPYLNGPSTKIGPRQNGSHAKTGALNVNGTERRKCYLAEYRSGSSIPEGRPTERSPDGGIAGRRRPRRLRLGLGVLFKERRLQLLHRQRLRDSAVGRTRTRSSARPARPAHTTSANSSGGGGGGAVHGGRVGNVESAVRLLQILQLLLVLLQVLLVLLVHGRRAESGGRVRVLQVKLISVS